MKELKQQVDEHNKRAIEEQRGVAIRRKEEEDLLKPYIKGLSDDVNILATECVILNRGGNQVDWELGRRLIKIHFFLKGQFQSWLKENGITRYKAYRLMKEIQSIPAVDLKALSRKPLEIDALSEVDEVDVIDGDELGKKIESGEATPQDFARRSPPDVKKLLAQVEKLKQENHRLGCEKGDLERKVDEINLGTIDEQKIREWIMEWQLDFIGGKNRVLALVSDISEASQMDVFAALQWFGREVVLLEMECAARFPNFSTWTDADQAAIGLWLERKRPASPLERIGMKAEEEADLSTKDTKGTKAQGTEEEEDLSTKGTKGAQPRAAQPRSNPKSKI